MREQQPGLPIDLTEDELWLLRILASHYRHGGDKVITVPDAFERFGIEFPRRWIDDALWRLASAGFVSMPPQLSEHFRGPICVITDAGLAAALELNRRFSVDDAFDLLRNRPANASHGAQKSWLSAPAREPETSVPAADRTVSLDHNDPGYRQIALGLGQLLEQVRGDNAVGATAAERERLKRSLRAAQELWSSVELKAIQIKIGVIMAIEDATDALWKLGKQVTGKLLIDLIKDYVKRRIGIDL